MGSEMCIRDSNSPPFSFSAEGATAPSFSPLSWGVAGATPLPVAGAARRRHQAGGQAKRPQRGALCGSQRGATAPLLSLSLSLDLSLSLLDSLTLSLSLVLSLSLHSLSLYLSL